MIMLANAPMKSSFSSLENLLWTASIAFPTWAGVITILYSLIVGGLSAMPFRLRIQS
jgi:hypothetical protein